MNLKVIERGDNKYDLYEWKWYKRNAHYSFTLKMLRRHNDHKNPTHYIEINKYDDFNGRDDSILIPMDMLLCMLPDIMEAADMFGEFGATLARQNETTTIEPRNEDMQRYYPTTRRAKIKDHFRSFMAEHNK